MTDTGPPAASCPVPVMLVNMPWSSLRPSLGLGLLAATLRADGVGVSVFNANIPMARRVGPDFYHYVSDLAPVEALLGEWVFAESAFAGHAADEHLEHAREAFGEAFPPQAEERLRSVRAEAGAFLDECLAVVFDANPSVVGFTSSFAQNLASVALAQRIKARRPEITVAFGGANCEDRMGLALHRSFPFIDLVFAGEADLSFPEAVARLAARAPIEELASIPGVIARGDDQGSHFTRLSPERVQDLDSLPYPDYQEFFADFAGLPAAARMSGLPLESSRGCWWGEKHHCTFCGLNGLAMAFRTKSPERVVTEVDEMTAAYGIRDVQFVDNILDMRYLRTVIPRFAEAPRPLAIFYETKANLRRDQLEQLRAGGVRAIQPGIESLDREILRGMRKGTTGVRSIELLRDCRELGIWPHWNILYGFPDEDPDAYGRMASLVAAISHLDPPNVCTRLRLDRFSPLFATAPEAGLTEVEPAAAYSALYALSAEDLWELAYYFDHRYADGRDPDTYTRTLRASVEAWQQSGHRGDLLYRDDGVTLRITDSRGDRTRSLRLSEDERTLYLACRTATTLGAACDAVSLPEATVSETLERWVRERLVVHLDDHHLAVAIDLAALSRWKSRRKPSWRTVRERSLGAERSGALFAAGSASG